MIIEKGGIFLKTGKKAGKFKNTKIYTALNKGFQRII